MLPGNLRPITYRIAMCPLGMALLHPAAETLLQYATQGCPVQTGEPWTVPRMQAAIDQGPHILAFVPEASHQLDLKVAKKVEKGQAQLVKWFEIKHNPPPQLKISLVAMVPHKFRPY